MGVSATHVPSTQVKPVSQAGSQVGVSATHVPSTQEKPLSQAGSQVGASATQALSTQEKPSSHAGSQMVDSSTQVLSTQVKPASQAGSQAVELVPSLLSQADRPPPMSTRAAAPPQNAATRRVRMVRFRMVRMVPSLLCRCQLLWFARGARRGPRVMCLPRGGSRRAPVQAYARRAPTPYRARRRWLSGGRDGEGT